MFHLSKGILVLSIPIALSVLVVCNHSVLLLILLILVHFILLKAIPALRGHENIWMFLFVAVSSVPINIYMLTVLNDHYFLLNSFLLLDILKGILYYVILLSV